MGSPSTAPPSSQRRSGLRAGAPGSRRSGQPGLPACTRVSWYRQGLCLGGPCQRPTLPLLSPAHRHLVQQVHDELREPDGGPGRPAPLRPEPRHWRLVQQLLQHEGHSVPTGESAGGAREGGGQLASRGLPLQLLGPGGLQSRRLFPSPTAAGVAPSLCPFWFSPGVALFSVWRRKALVLVARDRGLSPGPAPAGWGCSPSFWCPCGPVVLLCRTTLYMLPGWASVQQVPQTCVL